jgi:nucleoside-diphosphate-sugar epimerase
VERVTSIDDRVLVTGAAGYIGSALVRRLLQEGYRVRGLDNLSFGGESLVEVYSHPRFEFRKGDVRNVADMATAIQDVQAVVHLAAIVGDPACAQQPESAREINWDASRALFELCHSTSTVKRFIFASTCSNYGKMAGDGFVDEESPLKPVSLYAELKVQVETHMLRSQVREDFVPVALRFATAYGLSPRVRFDLTVNEFAREVALGRELEIFGEQFWRPYCHVDDLARACVLAVQSPPAKVRQNVFGVGDTSQNYQKVMLAEELWKLDPDAKIRFVSRTEDPRDYRVDFSKIRTELDFGITRTVSQGLSEIYHVVREGLISNPDSKTSRRLLKIEALATKTHWTARYGVLGRARSAATSYSFVLVSRAPIAPWWRSVTFQQPAREDLG